MFYMLEYLQRMVLIMDDNARVEVFLLGFVECSDNWILDERFTGDV
jgi:hypothetical protein